MISFRGAGHHAGTAPRWRLPSLCAVCRQWGAQRVCGECIERFAPHIARCARCAIELPGGAARCGACVAAPPPFERTLAAVSYAFPWDGLIARFKFHAALELADTFAQRIVAAHAADAGAPPDLLLPVPLSAQRQRERGYNQAWELARRIGRRTGIAADAHTLARVFDTAHQLALPPERRAANVRDAFIVEPARRTALPGRTVALVDDVMTTGATAAELARVLLRAGAARVEVWVFARTPQPALA